MNPRVRAWGACRALAVRSRPVQPLTEPLVRRARPAVRFCSDDANNQTPKPIEKAKTPGAQKIKDAPAAAVGGVAAGGAVEPASSGGAQEVAAASQTSHIETLDDAALEQILYGGRPTTSQREGGLTTAQEEALYRDGTIPPAAEAEALISATESTLLQSSGIANDIQNPGLKFALPSQPFPEGFNLKKRYHPVIDQMVRLVMRDGKLSVAQRHMAEVMNFLRTAPPPIFSPKFPLLPGTPPASHLSLNPILYITVAVDSVAPLVKIKNISGAAGGGRSLELPMPLALRQRRRTAFKWILDVVAKKPSKGSGRKQLANRIAEEIIAVVEGRSSVWEKRRLVHKVGTAARANMKAMRHVKKKKSN